jgi:NADH:ubiquinone oxidoreductase subunit 4 (subunit M)
MLGVNAHTHTLPTLTSSTSHQLIKSFLITPYLAYVRLLAPGREMVKLASRESSIMAKAAQTGLHTWLPDAMEGLTPVSALIHAATIVTAGVYLVLRSSPIIEYGPTVLIVITWLSALTAFFAATTGLLEGLCYRHDDELVGQSPK